MKTISKNYQNYKQAVNYMNRLYKKYFYVELVEFPLYSQSGTYTWKVNHR